MLHRVDEEELALGIVALRPAPACRHHGRQVVDGPGQVRRVVDVLAESVVAHADVPPERSEEHTSELQSLMRISYDVICLKKKKNTHKKEIIKRRNEKHNEHTVK